MGKRGLCGYCKQELKGITAQNRRLEKAKKLINRLWKFHHFLKRNKVDKKIIRKFWKTFKPILPNWYKKRLTNLGW